MAAPAVAWIEVTGKDFEQFGLTLAFFADPEGHVVGLSEGAVQ